MAKTLDEGFQLFLDSLTPDSNRSDVPEDCRERIMDCLEDNFGLYAFFLGGSLLSDTHIRGHGGVDYFASIGDDRLPDDSDAFLIEVGRVLDECFPDKSVTVKAPAVILPVSSNGSEAVRVVPARLAGQTPAGHRIYAVADGLGGWMTSSPDAHSAYIESVDLDLDGKLRPLIRFLKAWKFYTSGYDKDAKEILKCFKDGAEKCDEMVLVKDIPLKKRIINKHDPHASVLVHRMIADALSEIFLKL